MATWYVVLIVCSINSTAQFKHKHLLALSARRTGGGRPSRPELVEHITTTAVHSRSTCDVYKYLPVVPVSTCTCENWCLTGPHAFGPKKYILATKY